MTSPRQVRRLRDLLAGAELFHHRGSLDIPVSGISSDSRTTQPGDVFVCLPGYRTEGGEVRADRHAFIPQALERGAAALVVERPVPDEVPAAITVARVADAWAAIASMACAFHDHPSRSLRMIGVTGTSGKTSTTYFIESVLAAGGDLTARLGTIEYKLGPVVVPAAQTTPEAPELQRLLRDALDAGVTAVVMEVSSHALELRRVAGIAYDVAVFTNLSQDHLNFHPDMHHYRRAKGRLFDELASGGKDAVAVVNADDEEAAYIIGVNSGRLLTYGTRAAADITATDIATGERGTRCVARTPGGAFDLEISHLGDYNVSNALAAAAAGIALGLPAETIRAGIAATPQVPGRFEVVGAGEEVLVVVDYAHKPGALDRVLRSARALRPARLITVFGCGGDRDRGKRPQMGGIAARWSDEVVVTSDNSRSEDPLGIIADIVAGVPREASARVTVEADRGLAIRRAIASARPGDLVLIAGKGHETYQIAGGRRIPFDDREVARAALRERRPRVA